MRISDWSSDVCSSDLAAPELPPMAEGQSLTADYRSLGLSLGRHPMALLRARLAAMRFSSSAELRGQPDRRLVDRKSVVSGKSVSVRVDLGGRRIIKKTTRETDTLSTPNTKQTK